METQKTKIVLAADHAGFELKEKLKIPISELELSVRSSNCLKDANIKTIVDLVRKTEEELLDFRNFGKKSLTEIQDILKAMGLNLGMKLDMKKLRKKKNRHQTNI